MNSQLTRRHALSGSLAGALALGLAACGEKKGQTGGINTKDGLTVIKVGATPQPHVVMLQWVQDNLATDAGLELDIVEINDYQTPNIALSDGSLAANFYQTPSFLASQREEKGYDFTAIADVHIEPMGIYTAKDYKGLDGLPTGGKVLLNSDPANLARGLQLLASQGVIEIDQSVKVPDDTNVTSNPKQLTFATIEGSLLVTSMSDADIAIINGNYALEGGLTPSKDALVLEQGEGSPHVNQLVVRTEDKDNESLKKLAEMMVSDKFRDYINTTWTDGSVLPAF